MATALYSAVYLYGGILLALNETRYTVQRSSNAEVSHSVEGRRAGEGANARLPLVQDGQDLRSDVPGGLAGCVSQPAMVPCEHSESPDRS